QRGQGRRRQVDAVVQVRERDGPALEHEGRLGRVILGGVVDQVRKVHRPPLPDGGATAPATSSGSPVTSTCSRSTACAGVRPAHSACVPPFDSNSAISSKPPAWRSNNASRHDAISELWQKRSVPSGSVYRARRRSRAGASILPVSRYRRLPTSTCDEPRPKSRARDAFDSRIHRPSHLTPTEV